MFRDRILIGMVHAFIQSLYKSVPPIKPSKIRPAIAKLLEGVPGIKILDGYFYSLEIRIIQSFHKIPPTKYQK